MKFAKAVKNVMDLEFEFSLRLFFIVTGKRPQIMKKKYLLRFQFFSK